jgi:hypothetical protein
MQDVIHDAILANGRWRGLDRVAKIIKVIGLNQCRERRALMKSAKFMSKEMITQLFEEFTKDQHIGRNSAAYSAIGDA